MLASVLVMMLPLLVWLTPYLRIKFFFNDTATTEIYTLSLHDALPISYLVDQIRERMDFVRTRQAIRRMTEKYPQDRKSTRLNSSHLVISYAVFCLKKKTCLC